MKCDELKPLVFSIRDLAYVDEPTAQQPNFQNPHDHAVYKATEVDAAIEELKARIQLDDDEMAGFLDFEEECGGGDLRNYIAELKQKLSEKDKRLDVKDFAHVLKAFKFYLCQLTHCAYDERTAQWIIDNWEQDYERVEEYKG